MRSLSIQFTTLFALLPILGLGCAMKKEAGDGYPASYADEAVAMEPGYGGGEYEAGPADGAYAYADDIAEAPSGAGPAPTMAAPTEVAESGTTGLSR